MNANIDIFLPVIGSLVGVLIATIVIMVQAKQYAAIGFGVQQSKIVIPLNTKKSLLLTLLISLATVLGGLSYFAIGEYIESRKPPIDAPMVRITYSQLGAPPSLTGSTVEQVKVQAAVGAAPTVGVPKPVPDDQAVDESAATQSELAAMSAGVATSGDASGSSSMVVREDELIPDKSAFVAVDRAPEIVIPAAPVYPDIAKKAGIEGRVFLQLLIDHDGRVMRAEIAKSSGNTALDESAVNAAKKMKFTPAMAPGGKTVRVWVMYPVTFTLKQQ